MMLLVLVTVVTMSIILRLLAITTKARQEVESRPVSLHIYDVMT